jgi:hypothetical protein
LRENGAVECGKTDLRMAEVGQTRPLGFVGSMSGLPEDMTCSLQMVAPSANATAAGRRWVLPPVALARALDLDAAI